MLDLLEGSIDFDTPRYYEPHWDTAKIDKITSLSVAEAWRAFAEASIILRPYYWNNDYEIVENSDGIDHPYVFGKAEELLTARMREHVHQLATSLEKISPIPEMPHVIEIKELPCIRLLIAYDFAIDAFLNACVNASLTGSGVEELRKIALKQQTLAVTTLERPDSIVEEIVARRTTRRENL